jgi:cobalt-zinc-cadmium efflux system outer membrane protein
MKLILWFWAMIASILTVGFLAHPNAVNAQVQLPLPALDLHPLIAEALERNPEIAVTRQRYQAGKERIAQARTLPDPTLGVQLWNFPESFKVGQTQNTIFTLAQQLPFPGKLALQGAVAAEAAGVNEQAIAAKEREIVARVKQAYYDLFFAHKDLQIHHEQVDLLKQLFDIATAKFRTGKGTQVDVLKVQVELSDLYQRLPVIEQLRETAQANLNILMDRDLKSPLGLPMEPLPMGIEKPLEELERAANTARPELLAADRVIKRTQQARTLAERQYYPDFQVAVQRFQNYQAPDGFGAIATMTVPFALWTKPKYDAGVREAKAAEAAARAEYHSWHNLTRFQIKDLVAKVRAQHEVAKLYRSTIIPQAEQNLEAALSGYRTGRNDFLDVIDAERGVLEFRLAYYKAVTEREKQRATLEQVIGMERIEP